MLITAALIVKNEASRLEQCLASVRPLVDAIVVVDTGSTDDTPAIARRLGATVIDEPWQDDFARHRNTALDAVRTPWALVIDADEVVVDTDTDETRARLADIELPDILLVREWLEYPDGQRTTLLAPRLLRPASGIRYVHAVHEQLNVEDAPALLSNVVLEHAGYKHPATLRAKEERNLRIAEKMPVSPHALHCVARAAFSLERWGRAIEAAEQLLALREGSPLLAREVAILAALSALSAKDGQRFGHFLDAARRIDPGHVDVQFLGLLAAGARYTHAARHGHDAHATARPSLLFHDPAPVEEMLRRLTRRAARSAPHPEPDTRPPADAGG